MSRMKEAYLGDDLFTVRSPEPARVARDEAIARVEANAGAWIGTALSMLSSLGADVDLTGEDIRNNLIARGCPRPHHHNAWGALIRTAVKRQLLTDTGRMTNMSNERSHARRTPVYRRHGGRS